MNIRTAIKLILKTIKLTSQVKIMMFRKALGLVSEKKYNEFLIKMINELEDGYMELNEIKGLNNNVNDIQVIKLKYYKNELEKGEK